MDHANANALIHNGLFGERELLVLSDVATGFLGAYPVGSKDADRVTISLVHFLANVFHTDRAPEFIMAVRNLPGGPSPHRMGVPGVPQTDGVAESLIKQVIRGMRALLYQAGLPHCWWPFAARCFAALHNFSSDRGSSPMSRRHDGVGSSGPLIPFGALVHAMPSGLHRKRNLKFEPPPPQAGRFPRICGARWRHMVWGVHVGIR